MKALSLFGTAALIGISFIYGQSQNQLPCLKYSKEPAVLKGLIIGDSIQIVGNVDVYGAMIPFCLYAIQYSGIKTDDDYKAYSSRERQRLQEYYRTHIANAKLLRNTLCRSDNTNNFFRKNSNSHAQPTQSPSGCL